MELDALIRALAPINVTGSASVDIRDLAYDTRHVGEGALFFCVPGSRVDGHDLAWEAIERGAAAVVVERPLEVGVPQLLVPSMRQSMAVAADVFFGERTVVLGAMDAAARKDLVVLDRMFTHEMVAFALARGDDDFRLTVDRALSNFYPSPDFRELYAKWYGAFDDNARTFFLWNALPE